MISSLTISTPMATGEITCIPWATVLTVDMVTSSYLWAVAWTMAIEVTNYGYSKRYWATRAY